MSSVCYLNVSRMSFHSYVIRMLFECVHILSICTRMSFLGHSYVLACHPYVTRMYSYVIRMSFVCTRMSSVCHSYVLVCHPYVTRMWFYHEPSPRDKFYNLKCLILFNHNMPSIIITIFQTESFHLL